MDARFDFFDARSFLIFWFFLLNRRKCEVYNIDLDHFYSGKVSTFWFGWLLWFLSVGGSFLFQGSTLWPYAHDPRQGVMTQMNFLPITISVSLCLVPGNSYGVFLSVLCSFLPLQFLHHPVLYPMLSNHLPRRRVMTWCSVILCFVAFFVSPT